MRLIHYSYLLLFCLLATACEERIEWPLQEQDQGRLVVQAILTNELRTQHILLSQSYAGLDGTPSGVSDALLWVESGTFRMNFWPDPAVPGLYLSERPFAIAGNLLYQLHIDWQSRHYSASSKLSEVAPMPPITFVQAGNTDSLSLAPFAPPYSPNQQSMYEIWVDWSHLSQVPPTRARMYAFTFSSVHINQLIQPEAESVRFPRGSIVLVKKYGLNDDFAEFLRSMQIETQWNGNVFYAISENLPTNLSGDALGFFSTCALRSDTLIAQ